MECLLIRKGKSAEQERGCRLKFSDYYASLVWSYQPVVMIMQEIQATEAKIHLPHLLSQVEQGESFVITRHGKPIARLSPQHAALAERRKQSIESLLAFRSTMPTTSHDELIAMTHEGHRL